MIWCYFDELYLMLFGCCIFEQAFYEEAKRSVPLDGETIYTHTHTHTHTHTYIDTYTHTYTPPTHHYQHHSHSSSSPSLLSLPSVGGLRRGGPHPAGVVWVQWGQCASGWEGDDDIEMMMRLKWWWHDIEMMIKWWWWDLNLIWLCGCV